MNSKILLAAVLGGFLFFSGKKSNSKSKSSSIEEEDVVEEDTEDTEPEKEDKPPANQTPTYKTLTEARKKIIDEFLKTMPTLTSDFSPYGEYTEWSKVQQENNVKPLYQNYLATNIYHLISIAEGKTDVYNKFGEQPLDQYDGSLPYILQRGIKGQIAQGGPWIDLIQFDELQQEANKRLAKGIALWSDIKKYIDNNIDLDACPAGAVCK